MINEKDIRYAASLAKISIGDDELEATVKDIQNIIELANLLSEADTEGVEPTYNIFNIENAFRDDIVTNGNQKEKLMQNTPHKNEGCFTVPKVME